MTPGWQPRLALAVVSVLFIACSDSGCVPSGLPQLVVGSPPAAPRTPEVEAADALCTAQRDASTARACWHDLALGARDGASCEKLGVHELEPCVAQVASLLQDPRPCDGLARPERKIGCYLAVAGSARDTEACRRLGWTALHLDHCRANDGIDCRIWERDAEARAARCAAVAARDPDACERLRDGDPGGAVAGCLREVAVAREDPSMCARAAMRAADSKQASATCIAAVRENLFWRTSDRPCGDLLCVAARHAALDATAAEAERARQPSEPAFRLSLSSAARAGDRPTVRALLAAGLPADMHDLDERRALFETADAEIAGWLLARGAQPHLRDEEGYTPLGRALLARRGGVARILLAHGAVLDEAGPRDSSPLAAILARDRAGGARTSLDVFRDAGVGQETVERLLAASLDPIADAAPGSAPAEVLLGYALTVEDGSWSARPNRVLLRPDSGSTAQRSFSFGPGNDTPLVIASDRVEVELEDGDGREWRIEQRLVTTMSVSGQGPHVELSDWKQGTTPWAELRRLGPRRFRGLSLEDPPFPAYTQEELLAELRRLGLPDWAEALPKGPGQAGNNRLDVSAEPGLERVEWRISVREGSGWRIVRELSFVLAMGC